MTRTLGGTQELLVNRWVFLPEANLPMQEGEEPVEQAVAFLYIDHQCGTTINLLSRCKGQGDNIELYGERYFEPGGAMILVRYGAFSMEGARPLTEEEHSRFGVEPTPDWLNVYDAEWHDWQRSDGRFDPFRNEAFPDDVSVFFPREDQRIEELWVRLEAPFEHADFEGFLASMLCQPSEREAFVGIGDRVVLRFLDTDADPVLLIVGKVASESD